MLTYLLAERSTPMKLATAVAFFLLSCVFFVSHEGWSVIDSAFFIVFTITTVGTYDV
jgi:hypothetical protein